MENGYEVLRLKMALLNLLLAYDNKNCENPSNAELDALHSAMNLLCDYVGEQSQKFIDEMRIKYDRRNFHRDE